MQPFTAAVNEGMYPQRQNKLGVDTAEMVQLKISRIRSRLTRGPPQFWRLERICFAKLSIANIALALRLNEEPDFIRER